MIVMFVQDTTGRKKIATNPCQVLLQSLLLSSVVRSTVLLSTSRHSGRKASSKKREFTNFNSRRQRKMLTPSFQYFSRAMSRHALKISHPPKKIIMIVGKISGPRAELLIFQPAPTLVQKN